MTTTTDIQTAYTAARDDLTGGLDAAYSGNVQSSGAIARIAASALRMIEGSNGAEFVLMTRDGKKEVPFNAVTLPRYARGSLPKDADATDDMPSAGRMIEALACLSPRALKAMDDRDAALAEAKAAEKNPLVAYKHKAEAERLATALNTLKQPIRRAMTLAAYVLVSGDAYRVDTAHAASGILSVDCDTGEVDANGELVFKPLSVTFATAQETFKGDSKSKRAPNGSQQQNAKPRTGVAASEDGELAAVTMTPNAVHKGGEGRQALASALASIAGMLADLDGAPSAKERDSIARLYVACERLLDDEAMQRVADLRDQAAGE